MLTFHVPCLFRTAPGFDLWVQGPVNRPKDAIAPLTGVVETDWSPFSFTMNWKFTRAGTPVRFEKGEPFCMLVPVPRGLIETFVPRVEAIAANPEVEAQYRKWEESRSEFLVGLTTRDPDAVAKGWQKDYFQGKTPDGKEFESHQTRLRVREFEKDES